MKILVTGARGFVGRNLCAQLKNIRDGKARNYGVTVTEVYEYDLDSTPEELDRWCAEADFVFNLAGVNRPKDIAEFMEGNFGFASTLLDTLKAHGNTCPVMLSSSQQASLAGRFGNSEYGRSKKAGEELFLRYGEDTGAKVLVYRNDPEGTVLEWEVSGDKIEAVHMLLGYTHNIINLSETEDLVTVMYCNEVFNPDKPDTYFEPVKK